MIIYYNADCSKCREAKDLLDNNHCSFEIREYLNNPLNREELQELINLLGCQAIDIVRKKEPLFEEQFSDKEYSNSEWLDILVKHSVLMERPIVIDGEKAVIGRPPQLVLSLVK